MKKYALANYQIAISINDTQLRNLFSDEIVIGGAGTYMGNISVNRESNVYEVQGDNTGSYVFNQNLNKTGTVTLSINQLSDDVIKLKRIVEWCYTHEISPFTITVRSNTLESTSVKTVCICNDCLVQGVPTQSFGDAATNQTWTFICGKIDFLGE